MRLPGEGLCCGYDSGLPVTEAYRAPFLPRRIKRVVVEVDGAGAKDLGAAVTAAFQTQ